MHALFKRQKPCNFILLVNLDMNAFFISDLEARRLKPRSIVLGCPLFTHACVGVVIPFRGNVRGAFALYLLLSSCVRLLLVLMSPQNPDSSTVAGIWVLHIIIGLFSGRHT